MHKQKIFKRLKIFDNKSKFPNSEFLSNNGFYLPSGLGITNKRNFIYLQGSKLCFRQTMKIQGKEYRTIWFEKFN